MNDLTRRGFLTTATAFAATSVIPVFADEDGPAIQKTKRWFKEAKFGLMSHWGLYSVAAGEWMGRGIAPDSLSEWLMYHLRVPFKEYAKLAAAFNPIFFNPLEWMKRASDAGVKYFVMTAKHHEGFAMFRSRVSNYNVVEATPFKRDVIEEIAEACRATGVRLGLYYSQDVDWSEQNGGGRFQPNPYCKGRMWGNTWDWNEKDPYDFSAYFYGKAFPQVREMLTQYGDLCLIWFDCPNTANLEQTKELKALVRKLQPGCMVSGRIGHGLGDYVSSGDNQLITKTKPGVVYEAIGTMNDSWGYKPMDTNYKSVSTILELRKKNNAVGSNYMLNVGPDHLGRFPSPAVKILDALANT